jgi:formylglycine-generating enzyme required for sulfatase activity
MKSPLNTTLGLGLALGIFANPAMATVVIDYVTVGNLNNTADTNTYGSVSYAYRIGKNEVTNSQYVAFLNAVAKTDTYGLYNANMNDLPNAGGITRSGSSGTYSYTAKVGMENRPVAFVSWLDAARFVNWMHNGQTANVASTETGAYTLNGTLVATTATRNSGATIWLPSENEWYKAAYYDPNRNGAGLAGYWPYATQSATLSSNTIGNPSAANYTISGNTGTGVSSIEVTPVGAYGLNSDSAYGTNDQTGNVREFTDTISSGTSRVSRGGAWDVTSTTAMSSSARLPVGGIAESAFVGFRVAAVPEPSTALFSILAVGASLLRRNRRSH